MRAPSLLPWLLLLRLAPLAHTHTAAAVRGLLCSVRTTLLCMRGCGVALAAPTAGTALPVVAPPGVALLRLLLRVALVRARLHARLEALLPELTRVLLVLLRLLHLRITQRLRHSRGTGDVVPVGSVDVGSCIAIGARVREICGLSRVGRSIPSVLHLHLRPWHGLWVLRRYARAHSGWAEGVCHVL